MSLRLKSLSILLLCSMGIGSPLRAADVADYVPKNALGFVVVRDLAKTNAKLEKLIRLFEAPVPPPLNLFKQQTGFGEGFQEDGDLVIALLAPLDEFGAPGPMAVVPVTDYAAFVAPFDGDASGEICPVTVSEEDVLVAKLGEYALFMNPEYREQMQQIVAAQPAQHETVAALGEWYTANDSTLVLLPAGAELLVSLATREFDRAREQMEQGFEDAGQASQVESLKAMMEMYNQMLGFVGDEVTAAALGVAIDEAGHVKLGVRAIATENGKLAQVGQIPRGRDPLTGIPAGPFVVAGGGPWPKDFSEAMLGFSFELMKSMPTLYGLQDASDEDMQKLTESFKKATEGLSHMSFVLRPGEGDEPIYSNFYFAFHVESAEEYFKNYRESMDVWNEIASKAQGQRAFSYEITDETIADKPGLLITMDLAAAMQAQGVPQAEEMFKKMFGEDGKMRAYVAQVDENRVLVSYAAKPAVETLIESLRESTEGLASDAGVAATAKLLPSDAPFAMYVSPQGCVAWFRRMMNVMLAAFGGGGPVIPDFPETPPVGIAAAINGRVLATDVVVPNDMLQGLSQYIKQNQ